ncbi:MAG: CAAX prenyl protease-related protein [Verrucomicrobiota bacterium]
MPRLRDSDTAAHVAPLFVFMAFLMVPGWFRIDNSELPWFQRAPEHWVYPLQTFVCGALLLWFRRHYEFKPWRGLGLASLLAVGGIAVWIFPAWLYHKLGAGDQAPSWWSWFGLVERKEGFDPTRLATWPEWQAMAIVLRFVRMVIVVPLVEELFWRGFLMRYLNAGDAPWRSVPFGTHSWRAFGIVTLLVMLAHNPEDYPGALVWGSLVYWLAVRTRSLGACIVMHALGNLLLGLYALRTQQWGFW